MFSYHFIMDFEQFRALVLQDLNDGESYNSVFYVRSYISTLHNVGSSEYLSVIFNVIVRNVNTQVNFLEQSILERRQEQLYTMIPQSTSSIIEKIIYYLKNLEDLTN